MPGVSTSFAPLAIATFAFIAGHFILSATPVRRPLAGQMGEPVFLLAYSAVALGTFAWMCVAFARAPFEDLWGDPGWARWLSVLVMPFATIFLTAGYSTANPGQVGKAHLLDTEIRPVGIQKVTRHPVMVAIALWAAVHLIANGDAASLIMFGGILILAIGGMAHIEGRKRALNPEAWDRFRETSSIVPFAAIISGRTRVTLGEIGWNRIAAGVVLYLIFLFGHRIVIDVPLLPGLLPY